MFYTYIAFNSDNTIKSIGVTNNLKRRFKLLNLLVKKNKCKLVYYDEYFDSLLATKRENELKELHEKLRAQLIQENNPMLVDLLNTF